METDMEPTTKRAGWGDGILRARGDAALLLKILILGLALDPSVFVLRVAKQVKVTVTTEGTLAGVPPDAAP